jgi:hypothetical protein
MWMVISIRNLLIGGGGQDRDVSSCLHLGPSEHILRGARWCLDYINNN